MVDANYNFNAPVKVTELMRFARNVNTDEMEVLDGDIVHKTKTEFEEFSRDAYICWENIKELLAFPYKDDWKIKGDKFFITLKDCPNEMVVLGNLGSMVEHWTVFRTRYPLFIEYKTPPFMTLTQDHT